MLSPRNVLYFGSLLLAGSLVQWGMLCLPVWLKGTHQNEFSQPAHLGLLVLAELLLLVEASSVWMGRSTTSPAAPSTQLQWLAHRLALATGLLLLMLFWLGLANPHQPSALVWIVGTALALGGILLRGVAIAQLRSRFVTAFASNGPGPLLEKGIYARLRHPSETGLLLFTLGIVLLGGSLAALGVWTGLFVPLLLYRVRLEDTCLHKQHGVQFTRYRNRVPGLVPSLTHARPVWGKRGMLIDAPNGHTDRSNIRNHTAGS